MYKLVSIDMDGTLLNTNGKISKENLIAIKNAINKGVKIVIATGRGIKAVSRFLDEAGLIGREEYVVTNNGVAIYSTKDLKCIASKILESNDIKELCNLGIELGAEILVYDYKTEGTIVFRDHKFAEFERNHIGMPVSIEPDFIERINDNMRAFKIIYGSDKNTLNEIQNKVPNHIKEKFTVVRTLPNILEFFNKQCNKGNAIREFAQMFNIKREEIIAIGDQQNDREMIEYAGLGVAMGNAIDEIKNIANYITDTNNNNGVAKVIDKFIL